MARIPLGEWRRATRERSFPERRRCPFLEAKRRAPPAFPSGDAEGGSPMFTQQSEAPMHADAPSPFVRSSSVDSTRRSTALGGADALSHPAPDGYMSDDVPIRILLVDDHTILREGLASVLTSKGGFEVVGQAGDGATALRLFAELSPDVSIVDLRMTPMDGVDVTRAMREMNPQARVVVLTTYDTDEEVFRGLRAGAASYLLKDVDSTALIATIKTVHMGRKSISPEIAAKLADHVASDQLTTRQQEVLNCLAEGKSNLEIAHALFISEGTVKAHVKAILQKLGARDRTQAITIAIKRGMVRTL